jgi:hypothetical protein
MPEKRHANLARSDSPDRHIEELLFGENKRELPHFSARKLQRLSPESLIRKSASARTGFAGVAFPALNWQS